eukprot:355156-Chlamydomonas_euryale.AAC.3
MSIGPSAGASRISHKTLSSAYAVDACSSMPSSRVNGTRAISFCPQSFKNRVTSAWFSILRVDAPPLIRVPSNWHAQSGGSLSIAPLGK